MSVDKQELRRLAHEASETEIDWISADRLKSIMVDDWADFIAAANPAAILSLLDELEQCRADANDVWGLAQGRADAIDKLRAELELYRKDALRLEWMLAEQCIIRAQNGTGFPSVFSLWWVSLHEGQREWYATERDAIDAAMSREQSQ